MEQHVFSELNIKRGLGRVKSRLFEDFKGPHVLLILGGQDTGTGNVSKYSYKL